MIGNVLGNRYRILREIGAGGMAKVYLAEDMRGNELVALKVLYPQFGEDLSFIQRFNREAKLASTLTDAHIVRVLDYGADRDLHYLVMEYVEGKDLHDELQEQERFEWRHALEIIDQLATALEHAHVHGVVHRDVKPQNMMLNDSGLLKVLDFGIARMSALPSLTQSGFIGSPYYASPEQAMGEEVDIRSDIYSAGVVLYELLSGNIPFDAKSPWSIISQHITSAPPPIDLEEGEMPENVQDLLNRMLAKRPEERFQSPTALRQALAAVLSGQPVPEGLDIGEFVAGAESIPMVESLFERASHAIGTKEWMRAVDLLSQAAKLDPENEEIAERLSLVEAEARLSSLYKSGKRAMDNGRLEEAINHFNVIIELHPDYKDVKGLLDQCHQILKDENTQQFVETRYQEGLAHFETQRWDSAVAAFSEVQQLDPDYEKVNHLLKQARNFSNPPFVQKIVDAFNQPGTGNLLRWGAVISGALLIIIISFVIFGTGTQVSGNNELVKERLKTLYAEVQTAMETGNVNLAVSKLDEILSEDPDYADAAALKRDLVATPTPEPTPTLQTDVFAELLAQAESDSAAGLWADAIDTLNQMRAQDSEYEAARVASLFCDAYVGRGLETIANLKPTDDQREVVGQAQLDFMAGVDECPRRTDLQEQAERAAAYLTALNTPPDDFETLIHALTPIVAADPGYSANGAKQRLYDAYLGRAIARQESPELLAAALGDYEAALALNVDDPSEAQTRRAELLLAFTQQPQQPTTPPPVAEGTDQPSGSDEATPTPQPPVRIVYSQPTLLGPKDDTIFAGQFAEVILEWEPVAKLAADEYYDLTIMHLFADEPKYTGSTRTQESRVQISQDIGVGEAGGDRFYWWVTVRKDNTAPNAGGLDRPLSPRSKAGTFVWSP